MTSPQAPERLRSQGAVGLLAAILRDGPPRPSAACRGRWRLFDRALADRLNGGKHPYPDAVIDAARVCDACAHASGCTWRVYHSDVEPRRANRGVEAA